MISLHSYLAALRARWVLALAIVMLTTAAAVVTSLLLPQKYRAQASILIDAKPDPISALIYPGLASPAYVNTQIDVIRSERVAQRVVRELKLAEGADVQQRWREVTDSRGSIEQWLAASLQQRLDVLPSKESNVLVLAYTAADADSAARIVNAYVNAYVATTLDLRVEPARQYAAYFDERAKAARQALETAQAKLSAFQRERGITVNDERMDVESARLNELSTQLVMLQSMSADSSGRKAQAAGPSADSLQDVLASPLIAQLKSEVNRAEARLQELRTRYGDSYAQVVEARTALDDARARLAAETQRVISGTEVANNINRQREGEIRGALQAQRAKVLQMKTMRDEASVLVRDVEHAQRSFDAIGARLSQTSLESQSTQSNASALTQAAPPLAPAFPNVKLNTLLAALAGVVLALGLVWLLELKDRRVRDSFDASRALSLPLLGALPGPAQVHVGARSGVHALLHGAPA